MNRYRYLMVLLIGASLSGCAATMPTGPSVMVMPGPGKSFEAFQSDDYACRQWAERQTGATPGEATNETLAKGAVVGGVVGAAIGAGARNPAAGAAVGAGIGALGGTAVASGPAYAAGEDIQRRYDIAYQQCMYSKGNNIPGVVRTRRRRYPPPPPPPPDSSGTPQYQPKAYPPPPPPPPPK